MHVSQKELGRWVDLSGVGSAEALAHELTMVGLEVEDIVKFGHGCDDIVVGRIAAIEEHEKADKLVICRVDVGDGRERQIVCGAKNMVAGDFVAVALPGSQPPAIDFEIGERKVLGVHSEGMLCAADELGLADESDGLWILPAGLTLGTPVFAAMGLVDTHFEIGLTPNRPDCLSHLGIAREAAAIYATSLDMTALAVEPAWDHGVGAVADVASLDVQDAAGCPRYVLAVIENVTVGPSPDWLRQQVTAMGMRSINNLVDVTNVVLSDVGQPLHVFDLDRLDQGAIVVRRARAGETLEAIDHKTYELTDADLVIADATRPVAIAGVMGGSESEVTEATTRVLLECAYFDPTTVRRTSKRLGIHSESSHRFERGIDPDATLRNAALAMSLILRTQQGNDAVEVRAGVLEHDAVDHEPRVIDFDEALATRILGLAVPSEEIRRIFTAIGAATEPHQGHSRVTVPSWRPDLERPIDLVEEIARLHGFDNFKPTLPRAAMGAAHVPLAEPKHGPTIMTRRVLRNIEATRIRLLAAGLHEALSYSFMSVEELDRLRITADDPRRTQAAAVANPLTTEHSHMRTTVVPALLRALEANLAQRTSDVALFEIARRFLQDGEVTTLGMLLTGAQTRHFTSPRPWDLHEVKGILESLLGPRASTSRWTEPQVAEPYLHPGVQASWSVAGHAVGVIGQLHPALLAELEIEAPVYVAEVNFDALLAMEVADATFKPFPKYPAVARDFALLYDRTAPYAAIEDAVRELAASNTDFGALLDDLRLFDVYEGEQVPQGKRSIALQVVYRAADRTLTDDEIAGADSQLLAQIESRTGATLR